MNERPLMVLLDKEKIKEIIPHREPFLFVDEILEMESGKYAKGIKYVKEEEYYFKGHFPGNPIMPGVIIIETIAQVGAISLLSLDAFKGKNALFGGIDKARFKRIVRPGDILEIEINIDNFKRNIGKASAQARTKEGLACRAELLFSVI